MDHNPQTHGKPQSKPNQIARGLVYRRKAFALRTANPRLTRSLCPLPMLPRQAHAAVGWHGGSRRGSPWVAPLALAAAIAIW